MVFLTKWLPNRKEELLCSDLWPDDSQLWVMVWLRSARPPLSEIGWVTRQHLGVCFSVCVCWVCLLGFITALFFSRAIITLRLCHWVTSHNAPEPRVNNTRAQWGCMCHRKTDTINKNRCTVTMRQLMVAFLMCTCGRITWSDICRLLYDQWTLFKDWSTTAVLECKQVTWFIMKYNRKSP